MDGQIIYHDSQNEGFEPISQVWKINSQNHNTTCEEYSSILHAYFVAVFRVGNNNSIYIPWKKINLVADMDTEMYPNIVTKFMDN